MQETLHIVVNAARSLRYRALDLSDDDVESRPRPSIFVNVTLLPPQMRFLLVFEFKFGIKWKSLSGIYHKKTHYVGADINPVWNTEVASSIF